MPRIGHKEDCKCAICGRMRAALPPAPVETGPTLGSLRIGMKFRYHEQIYQKLNGQGTVVNLNTDSEPYALPSGTIVELLPDGRKIEEE